MSSFDVALGAMRRRGLMRASPPTVATIPIGCYQECVDSKQLGSLIIEVGFAIAVVGVAVRFGLFSWFGRLPGDIRYEGESTRVYIPLTSMLLVSAGLSLLAWLWRRASG